MGTYTASTYGDRIAEFYDERHHAFDEAAVRLLAEPGVEAHGIDASRARVERQRAKPGGERIHVTFGDFGEVGAAGAFAHVSVYERGA